MFKLNKILQTGLWVESVTKEDLTTSLTFGKYGLFLNTSVTSIILFLFLPILLLKSMWFLFFSPLLLVGIGKKEIKLPFKFKKQGVWGIVFTSKDLTFFKGFYKKEIKFLETVYVSTTYPGKIESGYTTDLMDLFSFSKKVYLSIPELGVKGVVVESVRNVFMVFCGFLAFNKAIKENVIQLIFNDKEEELNDIYCRNYYPSVSIEKVLKGETLNEFVERIKIKIINAYKEKDNAKSKEHEVL